MRALLVIGLLVVAAPAAAQAPERPLVMITAAGEPSLGAQLRAWVRTLRPAIGATRVRALGAHDCWPEDASCAASHVQGEGRILLARVLWERTACVTGDEASGAATTRRMLRTSVLDLTLIDAHGATLAHVTRAAEATASERRAALPALLAALGLAS